MPAVPLRRPGASALWHGVSFFKAQSKSGQGSPQGRHTDLDAMLGLQPLAQLLERLIVHCSYPRRQRLFQSAQFGRDMVALHPGRIFAQTPAPGARPGHVRFAHAKASCHFADASLRVQYTVS